MRVTSEGKLLVGSVIFSQRSCAEDRSVLFSPFVNPLQGNSTNHVLPT